ncbi:O-antigen ligase family protein [Luteimicrobium subarcticum]|uniref:O-antigen ligase family protein n=1 Tax=Luteimicrobium subarcticum TaxID=620910 RepID=UPI0012FDA3D9|nr:O-antigen ligase family protein [Luteimicrobium subarcticum]
MRIGAWTTTALAAVAVLAAIGWALPADRIVAVALVSLVVAVGASLLDPMAVPLLSMLGMIVVQRVGGGVSLSLSDFVLFGATWVALALGPRPFSRPMRALLWISAFYQLTTLFTVIANPYTANVVEWCHAWMLVAGALVVGWALGRSGHASAALALLLAPCAAIAVGTLFTWLTQAARGDFGAVYLFWPYGMHKNYIGTTLAFAAAVMYARPPWLRWPRNLTRALFWLFVLAVAASQARQAYVSLAVGLVILMLRPGQGVRHSRWVLVPIVVAVVFVLTSTHEQVDSGNQFNSTYQRLSWFQDSLTVWRVAPLFGVGLRWWYTGKYFSFQPPNAELEVLSSTGVVGLTGFVVLAIGGLWVLWKVRADFGTVAFTVVLMRLVQGQLDLFWVAVSVSVPYLIAGVCVGAAALADERGDLPPSRRAKGRHHVPPPELAPPSYRPTTTMVSP